MNKDKKFFHGHSRLAEERASVWSTQQDAADFFGLSRVTWGCYERGEASPDVNVLAGMAQQGADALYILTGQRNPLKTTIEGCGLSDEMQLLDDYRHSSKEGKAAIRAAAQSLRTQAAA